MRAKIIPSESDFLLYTTPNGEIKVNVLLKNETIWLSQKDMSNLFDCSVDNISLHLKNIFQTKELMEKSVIEDFSITASDGKKYNVKHYNLDAIISVGYRVNSIRGTQFRIWATKQLKELIVKGFVMDDERLKNSNNLFGKDYFKELLERVRSIRASERRIYQQITDVFAECTIDYNKNSEITHNFYAMIQNNFHFAITGKTAAEIVFNFANIEKPFMGLKAWKNSPKGRIIKSDTIIAKNYLNEEEIKKLERSVSSYFDYIERLIEDQYVFTMEQLAESVNEFLKFNRYEILDGKGKISHKEAEQKAFLEYDKFNKTQLIESDFDKEIKKILKKNKS